MTVTSAEFAADAGLRYVSDADPGIRRVRRGRGFSYHRPDGELITDERLIDKLKAVAIPPAWTDVWICRDLRGHILATGRDDRDRKQYIYHPMWREVRDADKFDSLLDFGRALPRLRQRVEADLSGEALRFDMVVSLVVRLLDETLARIGNGEYARDNETYGLTTLRPDHVAIDGRLTVFEFVAKGGAELRIPVVDRGLAEAVAACQELRGQHLFTYLDADDRPASVTSTDVNDYLGNITGADVTAKDFRTWGATVTAAHALAEASADGDPGDDDAVILAAIDVAADCLSNTREVSRSSYIHPAVPEAYRLRRILPIWKRVRTTRWMARPEWLTLRLLQQDARQDR